MNLPAHKDAALALNGRLDLLIFKRNEMRNARSSFHYVTANAAVATVRCLRLRK